MSGALMGNAGAAASSWVVAMRFSFLGRVCRFSEPGCHAEAGRDNRATRLICSVVAAPRSGGSGPRLQAHPPVLDVDAGDPHGDARAGLRRSRGDRLREQSTDALRDLDEGAEGNDPGDHSLQDVADLVVGDELL